MCLELVGRVVTIEETAGEALMETATGVRRVSLGLLRLQGGDVALGDWVIAHTGFVVSRLDEQAARRIVEEQAEMRAVLR